MKALVVGGEFTFVRDVLAPRLAGVGIEVDNIWDWDHKKPIQGIPAGCDCVIVLKDMTNHCQRDTARRLAKRQGIGFAEIPRKWAVAHQQLIRAGLVASEGKGEDMGTEIEDGGDVMVLQEDFTQTLARVVDFSRSHYEENSKRPKASLVAASLGIPTYHVAMQRGINQGVATAKGQVEDKGDPNSLNELIEIALQDHPESILDIADMTKMLTDMLNMKLTKAVKKNVLSRSLQIQRRWQRAADKPDDSPEKVFLRGLQLKWCEGFCRQWSDEKGDLPSYMDCNVASHQVFKSTMPKPMYEKVIAVLNPPPEMPETSDAGDTKAETVAEPVQKNAKSGVSESRKKKSRKSGKKSRKSGKKSLEPGRYGMRQATLDKINPFRHLVGVEHDESVAEKAGVSRTSVRRYRQANGIPRVPSVTYRRGTIVTRTDTDSTSELPPAAPHVSFEAMGEATYMEPGDGNNVPDVVWEKELIELRRENAGLRMSEKSLKSELADLKSQEDSWKAYGTEKVENLLEEIKNLTDEIERLNEDSAGLRLRLERTQSDLADARSNSQGTNGDPTTGAMIDLAMAMGHKVTFQIHSGD